MDTLFFVLSKTLWPLLRPDALLLLALVALLVLIRRQSLRWAQRLLLAVIVALLIVAVVPLWAWLQAPLEHRFAANPELPARVDGIIVLGGFLDPELSAYWQQPEVSDSAERALAFAELAKRYPDARLVMSGGSGLLLGPGKREADYMPRLLESLGVDGARVLLERDSRNTYENAVNSKRLVQPKPGEHWVLVTSAFHMPRAVGVFCRQGWPVTPWPVDHQWSPQANAMDFELAGHWLLLDNIVHEWLGLLAYHLSGKTDALFPAGCAPSP
ncbi:MAG TPA: YdcF family protein [Candidatus Acidoferrum sp.]|nr:YdcF family protein [Candidatus Acidoferrum sp.]